MPGKARTPELRNGRLPDETLKGEILGTPRETRVLVEQGRRHCNQVRRHSALGYRPPAPAARQPGPVGLLRTAPVARPGVCTGRRARKTVVVPADWQGSTVMIHAVTAPQRETAPAVLVNGKMIRRHHHGFGLRPDLNVPPLCTGTRPTRSSWRASAAEETPCR